MLSENAPFWSVLMAMGKNIACKTAKKYAQNIEKKRR